MTMPPVDANGVPDFTAGDKPEPRPFLLHGQKFMAVASVSPDALKRLTALHGRMGDLSGEITPERFDQILDLIADMFSILLVEGDGARFAAGLRDPEWPFNLVGEAIPIIYWLLEQYGLRPTPPSSALSAGSTEGSMDSPSDGESSTGGASPTDAEIISDSTQPTG